MPRNIDLRIEVTCPIYDDDIKNELRTYMEIQWADNVRARILNEKLDAFTHLEMHSMNDIQRLLKLVRKLQSQFEKSGVEGLSDDADASQIGGSQEDVEDLLAQFDM